MNNKTKIQIAVVLVLCTASYWAGYKNVKSKTETKVTEDTRKDVTTVRRTVTRPDGTRETVTERNDRSRVSKVEKTVVVVKPKDNFISVAQVSTIDPSDRAPVATYELSYYRRVYSSAYLGLGVDTKKNFKLGIGLEF